MIIRISNNDMIVTQIKEYIYIAFAGLFLGYCWIIVMVYDLIYEFNNNHNFNLVVLLGGSTFVIISIYMTFGLITYLIELNNQNVGIKKILLQLKKNKKPPRIIGINYPDYLGERYILFKLSNGIMHRTIEILIPIKNFDVFKGMDLKNIKFQDDSVIFKSINSEETQFFGENANDIKFLFWIKTKQELTNNRVFNQS